MYLTIGNISKAVRNSHSHHCWLPIAYLPVTKFNTRKEDGDIAGILTARLFHQALQIVLEPIEGAAKRGVHLSDSTGDIRICYPRISTYMCDYPEQCLVNCLAGYSSPNFEASYHNLEDSEAGERRTYETLMESIRMLREELGNQTVLESGKAAKALGLNGVLYPWWEKHEGYQPWLVIAPDLLHGVHKFFRDHILRWVQSVVGKKELDHRLMALQPNVGFRHFREGISGIAQMTGREDREVQRYIVAIAHGAPKCSEQLITALRSFLDFSYIAQYESHNSTTLDYLDKALQSFHKHKKAFADAGGRVTKNGKPHFKIPKLYNLHVYRHSITYLGSSPQFSTEHGERAHIPLAKHLYQTTNRKDFGPQMCRTLDRQERLRNFLRFVRYAEKMQERNAISSEMAGFSESEIQETFRFLELLEEGPMDSDDDQEGVGDVDKGHEVALEGQNTQLFSLTRAPHHPTQEISHVAAWYQLPDLRDAISVYIQLLASRTGAHRYQANCPAIDQNLQLPYTQVHVWTHFRLQVATIQDSSTKAPARTIQALPPSANHPQGRCNIILVHDNDAAKTTGIKGKLNASFHLCWG